MGETTKAESTKPPQQQQQHLQQTTQLISSSSSPKESLDHQETPPSQLHHLHHHYHHRQPFISSPLYIPLAAAGSSAAAINPKRPRYGSSSAPLPQWKTLPSPSSLEPPKQAQMVVFNADASTNPISSPPSTSTNPTQPQPSSAAAGSSSETAGSSPIRSPALSSFAVGQEQITSKPETDQPLPQFRKGKYVSPVWKPNEMLWLARAWRVQYQLGGGGGGSISGENQETGQLGRGKTRAEKDREVAEFLNRHGINRDAKTAGTKWDNMLGEFRKVYEWERGGERERFGKSYFRLSPYERKQNRLPASFDEEVFEELAQFMGPRMRAPVSRGGSVPPPPPSSMMIPADLDVVRLPLPPPFPTLKDDDVPTHPGRTIGDHNYPQFQHLHSTRGTGMFSTSSSTFYDPSMAPIQHCSSSSSTFKELRRIGKIRMTWEESVSLWAEEGEIQRGRIRVKGLSFLNAEELLFFDDSLVACSMEAFEDGPLKGFSVDRFLSGQQVKVFGRKKSTSASSSGLLERSQLPFSEPLMRSIIPTREFQDPSEHYLSSLRVSPGTLPSLFELSWYLQEPPPEDLRFPLRKDVYKDLPPGKELFFTISSAEPPLDCRAITYDIVSSIITTRSNPNFIVSSRDSLIPLWDDCVNRIVSKFCPTEMVIVRKSSSPSSSQESVQDRWPNVLGFVKGFGLWRGEESDHTKEDEAAGPSSLIVEKLLWSYVNLPYILGYYAVGFKLTFCALSRTQDHQIICTDLYSFDASSPSARIKALVPCYRLSCLLPLLADRCIGGLISDNNNTQFCYSDFERIDHGDHITEVTPNTVTKYYTTKRKWTAVKEIYDFLDLRVPHAEHLHRANENDLSLTFKPRGVKVKPRSVDQLIESLMCVTKALVALHDLSFMHRDLGWDKVMMMIRVVDRSTDTAAEEAMYAEWFLCGFEEAHDAPHLNPHETAAAAAATAEERWRYAPEMGRGLHGVKVDVWGIGYMIKTCGLSAVPKMLRELQSKCLEPNPEQRPTAADCYHHLLQVQSARAPPY